MIRRIILSIITFGFMIAAADAAFAAPAASDTVQAASQISTAPAASVEGPKLMTGRSAWHRWHYRHYYHRWHYRHYYHYRRWHYYHPYYHHYYWHRYYWHPWFF